MIFYAEFLAKKVNLYVNMVDLFSNENFEMQDFQ